MTSPPPTILDGRYELLELLGEGGMGQVFKARHLRLGKIFAIKSLRNLSPDPNEQAKFLEAFETEARTLAELDHPALAQVSDFFEFQGVHYLVMEFVSGRTLARVLELAPRLLSERRVLQWAEELCGVLDYLHTRHPPVIVRDLKPENVMLDDRRRLRLLDFGIAKRLQAGVGTRDIIKGMGTAEYAPLEQYGAGSTDQRSDIYAFGGTLYYLLTELPPPPAWRRASEKLEPTPPSQVNDSVSPRFESLLLRMMALRREDRPDSIRAVLHEIQAIRTQAKIEDPGSGQASSRGGVQAAAKATVPHPLVIPPAPEPVELPDEIRIRPLPSEPSYGSSQASPSSTGAYGLQGTALPHSRTQISPAVAPSSTGRIPQVRVVQVQGVRRYATTPRAVAYCPGRPLVAVAGRYLQVWNAESGQLAAKLWTGEQELTCLDFSFDGRYLLTAESEGEIKQYDLAGDGPAQQVNRRGTWGLFSDRLRALAAIHGTRWVAVASDSSNIRIFNTAKVEVVQMIEWHQSGLLSKFSKKTLCLASSRQGFLAAGGADGSLSLYDVSGFTLKKRLNLGPGEVTGVSFSPDGTFLAAIVGRRVLVFKASELELVHELKHPSNPLSVSFSYDLRVIATGASDCYIRLFHLNTGQELHRLNYHAGAVLGLDFSDFGPSLVSIGHDRRLFVTSFSW